MRISPFLEGFGARGAGVFVISARFVRVPAYIRGALRTTCPTALVSGYPGWGQARLLNNFRIAYGQHDNIVHAGSQMEAHSVLSLRGNHSKSK